MLPQNLLWRATTHRRKRRHWNIKSRSAQLHSVTRECSLASRRSAAGRQFFCLRNGYSCLRGKRIAAQNTRPTSRYRPCAREVVEPRWETRLACIRGLGGSIRWIRLLRDFDLWQRRSERQSRPYEYALEQAKADQATLEGQINDERRRIATEQSAVGTARAGILGSQSGVSAAEGAYEAASAAVERAVAAQTAADAQLKFAQNDYNRIAPLLTKHYVTTQQVHQSQTALRVAQEASHEAASQLLQAQAQRSITLSAKQSAQANLQASQSKLGEAQHTVDTLETFERAAPESTSEGRASTVEFGVV
jgi:hypothetical protein